MIGLAVLAAILVLAFGGKRLARAFGNAMGSWRPLGGVFAVVLLTAAAVLAVREDWAMAALFAALGGGLALAARFRRGVGAPAMSARDARALLGVPEGASRETVEAAYRRLIRSVHPDAGGTAGLAAQLNAARAVLLRG